MQMGSVIQVGCAHYLSSVIILSKINIFSLKPNIGPEFFVVVTPCMLSSYSVITSTTAYT